MVLAPTRPILMAGLSSFQELGEPRVGRKRRRAGVHDDEVVAARDRAALIDSQLVSRRIEQARVRHQRGRLRQPGREPERFDLALGLVARTRAPVETIERRRLQKQCLQSVRGRGTGSHAQASQMSGPTPALYART